MWTERTGRDCPIRKISLLRTAKIWPLTCLPASEAKATANGAILAGVIAFNLSTRARWASSPIGMVPIMRLQAKGEIQFEVTPKRAISRAIELDRPAMPSLAAA